MSDFHQRLQNEVPRLVRYAAALTRDADQALDLVEDTVLEALSSLDQRPRRADLSVWLLMILHDHRRNPFRQNEQLRDASRPDPDPAALLILSDFERALGQLREEQRAVILLVGLEGMQYDETATILRVSASTVRSRLARGRQALCRILGATDAAGMADAA